MNFLPFVFTMLLLLSLMTSFAFTSLHRLSRETEIIVSEHQSYLKLLSQQNKKVFEKKKSKSKSSKNDSPEKKNSAKEQKKTKPYPRDRREGFYESKLNLHAIIDRSNPQLSQAVEKIFIRLIDLLYGSYDFYKSAHKKNIGQILIKQMALQEIESFEQLELNNDKELARIYYHMLKGTNTSYPSLTEYCVLGKKSEKPIYFKYATTPIMRAALGEELAQKLFDLEKKSIQPNKSWTILNKKDFVELTQKHPSSYLFSELFEYSWKKKCIAQIHQEKEAKVRSFHETDFDVR